MRSHCLAQLGTRDEENLSAKPAQAEAEPWLSRQDGHACWPAAAEAAAGQGPQAALGLAPCQLVLPVARTAVTASAATHSAAVQRGLGFPASHRLRQPEEYDAVFKGADFRVGGKGCLLLVKQGGEGPNRLGLVVGKKAEPKAVNRNRIKRLVRETFRQTDLGAQGLDLVFLARGKGLGREEWSKAILFVFVQLQKRLAATQKANANG